MRKVIALVAGVAVLAVANAAIHAREQLLTRGRVVLLELAPVDPRSLMQGDYMALRFSVADAVDRGDGRARNGVMVLKVDAAGVGTFAREDDGTPLQPQEARLHYRVRNGAPKLATNAFFFQEGHAERYEQARYGEFRVDDGGDAILTGMRDADRNPLGAAQPPTESGAAVRR